MSDALFQVRPEEECNGLIYSKTWKEMTGVEKIAMKRLRQKVRHGHTVKRDYEAYPDFELIDAAKGIIDADASMFPTTWDKEAVNSLCAKDLEERLAIAGAMLAAQIDVLNFKE